MIRTDSASHDTPHHEPRIGPLPEAHWDKRTRGLLATAPRDPDGRVPNIFATLVRHPDLYESYNPFGEALLFAGRLPGRTRELLILRTAYNTRAFYEWGRHIPFARAVGLGDTEIERVRRGPEAGGWTEPDLLLLRAADELHRDARVSRATWDGLAAHHDDAELIEITILVGQYHMVAFFLNSAGTELDPGF